jgi:Tol biopolymer transport system component
MSTTVFDRLRWPRLRADRPSPALGRRGRRRLGLGGAGLLAMLLLGAFAAREPELPASAEGTLVYVSDRSGRDSLYVRRLPDGKDTRLVSLEEPVAEPALSPDGREVVFSVGGRIGVVPVAGGAVRMLTLGSEWRDAEPAWSPDGKSVFVSSRRADQPGRDIHELVLAPVPRPCSTLPEGECMQVRASGSVTRRPIVQTSLLDESQPVASPDGSVVVFLREEALFRVDRRDGKIRRLTGGFRKARAPRFLPDGRIAFLWAEGKEFGVDAIDIDGKARETLDQGTAYYRTQALSPDGRYAAATFTYDLGFHFWQAIASSHREELRLVDLRARTAVPLAKSRRHANHSADWGR